MSPAEGVTGHQQPSGGFERGIAAKVQQIRPSVQPSPMQGYEHVRGFGIYALPFDSGHVLALRVFPENDFAPYTTVWHRTPDGRWSIYVDGPSHNTACPRYYGTAADYVQTATITLDWTGPMELQVRMDDPELRLTIRMDAPLTATILNAIGARLPATIWRIPGVASVFARVADTVFDIGDVTLIGTAPNGQRAILMPRQMYPIESAVAMLDGDDLGEPITSKTNPTMGDVAFPARPMLAIGEAYFEILDQSEHDETFMELNETSVSY
ncbi:hypothetical protein ACFQJ5_11840 [Halomicroarcula sp. GCM10025324]|uniref:hypothetical protein n=1 Tax=Haloarcula TaxID=2237 RepID=UPI0023E8655E|nr:hypothetical protein [Halomicroarcula sp. ZS-22-S1]